jgi:hypothetical protein
MAKRGGEWTGPPKNVTVNLRFFEPNKKFWKEILTLESQVPKSVW